MPAAWAGSTPCPLRYAVAVNSNSAIVLNKLDILSGIETIRLCVAYEIDGRRVETWPSSGSALSRAVPIYEDFEGWEEPIHDVRSLAGLPENARRYVSALEEHAGVPIVFVSRGAGADADHRTGLAADAAPPHDAGLSRGASVTSAVPARILVLGGGGREHALAWKLAP